MRLLHLVLAVCCTALWGQSPTHTKAAGTFHVSGTIMQCGKAVRSPDLAVAFEGSEVRTVKASAEGAYAADIPAGIWTATAVPSINGAGRNSGMSRSRKFRATAGRRVVMNVFLRPPVMCDLYIVTQEGGPPTQKEIDGRDAACYEEQYYALPSEDGAPFELVVGGLHKGFDPCSVNRDALRHPEFGTYNSWTVEADEISYNPVGKTLDARGNVVIYDDFGEHRKSRATFEIWDGRARPLP
jgi:hypothetical protein